MEQIRVSEAITCSPETCMQHYLTYSSPGSTGETLNILHVNIRSLNKNFDELNIYLQRLQVQCDIIILSECWLSKISNALPILTGYNVHRSTFNNQNDGVVIYIQNDIQCEITEPNFQDANCLVIKYQKKFAILAMYRSPSYKNTSPFLSSLDELLSSLSEFPSIALLGDININIAPFNGDYNSDRYLNIISSHGLLPTHLFPTRGENCIDHVMLKTSKKSLTIVLESAFTDHMPTLFSIKLRCYNIKPKPTIDRIDVEKIETEINNKDFSDVMQETDCETAARSKKIQKPQ